MRAGGVAGARWALLVAAAGVVVYLNTLGHGFALDDLPLVRDNPSIESLRQVPRLFVEPYWGEGGEASGLYRPVTVLSYALNRALGGPGPFGFHLVNVLLHGLVSALVWFVARRAGVHWGTALVCGLLFAVHPLHVEAVANVAGRAELLAAVGVLGAWIAHRRAVDAQGSRRLGWRGAGGALYLLALLSKETAVLAPALFWLDDRLRAGRAGARAGNGAIARYGAYGLALGLGLLLRVNALGGLRGAEDVAFLDNPPVTAGTGPRIGTALWVLARYAGLFFWPARLSSDYSHAAIRTVESFGDPRWMAGALVIASLVALGAWAWYRSRPTALAVASMAVFLLPASNLLFPAGTLMAERLAYLPSFGACLLLGHVVARTGTALRSGGERDSPPRRAAAALVVAASALFVALLAARTWTRNPVWADNLTLALHDAGVQPHSAKLHAGAAIALHEAGRFDEAERHYREALAIYADYAQVHYNLGELLAARGAEDEAIEHLERAVAISAHNPRPYKTLARLLRRRGRIGEAIDAFARGAERDPGDFRFRFDYGRTLLGADQWGRAIDVFSALAIDDPAGLWGKLGLALVRDWQGRTDEAIAICRELLRRADLSAADRRDVERLLDALTSRAAVSG